jgi:diguanylate cyclase (GGDEF)-like protein/PAS domain S-box-containing protein
MDEPDLHPAEAERLAALGELGLLDTPPEERFDRITRLAAAMAGTPIALVTLVDHDRQWFKAKLGLDLAETPRGHSFCAHAIIDADADGLLVIDDTTEDPRFADNPLVLGPPLMRFYAGTVIHSPDGHAMGTLCVIDRRPRHLTAAQRQALTDLGAMVEDELARQADHNLLHRLDRSERMKSSVLELLTEGLILQGSEGEILEWNSAAERLLGTTGPELTGASSLDPRFRAVREDGTVWADEDRPIMVAMRTGEPVRDQLMGIEHDDGTRTWLSVSVQPAAPAPDGSRRVLTVLADVTERRRLELALQNSEETARTSLDALEQGVILGDRLGHIRRINPAAERLLGYTATELAAKWSSGDWETYAEDGALLTLEQRPVYRALLGDTVRGEVVDWLRADGEHVLLRISCTPDADLAGGILVTFTDITEEHRMLLDLRRFRHLFQHANDVIAVVDAYGQSLYSSPSSQRVLGYPEGWTHPAGILGLVHKDDVVAAAQQLRELVDGTRGPEPFLVRVLAHAGDWRHLECVGVNLLHEPAVQGIVLTMRDATERVELTRQLAHLAGHDHLTDLPNRTVLAPRIEQALARTSRQGVHVGLCFIDLDRFKDINDTLGHAVGDSLLVEVADRIQGAIRAGDTAVRVGGDEFVVILDPVASTAAALEAACRIRDALVLPPLQRGIVTVGASVGVAVSQTDDVPATLLSRADAALYRAKVHRASTVELAADPLPAAGVPGA